jgi:hypothetical protein
MIIQRPIPPDEGRRPEPEIIPPDRHGRRNRRGGAWSRIVIDESGVRRVYVGKINPLGLVLVLMLAGLVSIGLLIFFLSAFLILAPVIGLLIAGAVIASVIRAYSRR